jgi:hypothetical protein
VENFTDKEKNLLIHIGFLVLDDERLSSCVLRELLDTFDIEADSTSDTLLEKLTDLV